MLVLGHIVASLPLCLLGLNGELDRFGTALRLDNHSIVLQI